MAFLPSLLRSHTDVAYGEKSLCDVFPIGTIFPQLSGGSLRRHPDLTTLPPRPEEGGSHGRTLQQPPLLERIIRFSMHLYGKTRFT